MEAVGEFSLAIITEYDSEAVLPPTALTVTSLKSVNFFQCILPLNILNEDGKKTEDFGTHLKKKVLSFIL